MQVHRSILKPDYSSAELKDRENSMILQLNNIKNTAKKFEMGTAPASFCISAVQSKNSACISISGPYRHVFGLGERFDVFDQAGQTTEIHVQEKFTRQGKLTYLPVPFFFTDSGAGIYIDTKRVTRFIFKDTIQIELPYSEEEVLPDLHFFTGTPGNILKEMSDLLGASPLPPRWSFGPWISANRWNSQALVEQQTGITLAQHFPASVLVLEAWSDESTFYLWNDATYKETTGEEPLAYEELFYPKEAKWPSPADMIANLHENGIRLILWQVPVLKKLEAGRMCLQHDRDTAFALKNKYVVENADGTPYVIPEGHWFPGSYVPDFTSPKARAWWFSKRRYLTDIGVDGFKTDGGEFIYDESTRFSDGSTGKEMINDYPAVYTQAYSNNNGPDQILFSRAGYTRSRTAPIHWAGDQISTWEEMRNVMTAGLSAGLSGITYWSFDIAGFAGPMPDTDLYSRSVQWSVFAPIMQWHSEPIGGQFSEFLASSEKVNDRSPWNIASYYNKPELVGKLRFHFALRMNLLPSIYSYAVESAETGLPMMRPLMIDYPQDPRAYAADDEYIFGNLLVAPVLTMGVEQRSVYIPDGTWINLWTGEVLTGPDDQIIYSGDERIPVLLRSGKALLIDLDDGRSPGIWEKDGRADIPSQEDTLYLALGGAVGEDVFHLDTIRSLTVAWDQEEIRIRVIDATGKTAKDSRVFLNAILPVKQDSIGIPIYAVKNVLQET